MAEEKNEPVEAVAHDDEPAAISPEQKPLAEQSFHERLKRLERAVGLAAPEEHFALEEGK
jgi:hypothetical protein